MLEELFWNLFEKTGNINAYLAVREYNNNEDNKEELSQGLELKGQSLLEPEL